MVLLYGTVAKSIDTLKQRFPTSGPWTIRGRQKTKNGSRNEKKIIQDYTSVQLIPWLKQSYVIKYQNCLLSGATDFNYTKVTIFMSG